MFSVTLIFIYVTSYQGNDATFKLFKETTTKMAIMQKDEPIVVLMTKRRSFLMFFLLAVLPTILMYVSCLNYIKTKVYKGLEMLILISLRFQHYTDRLL